MNKETTPAEHARHEHAAGAPRARRWLGVGLPAVILIATYAPFFLLRSELPDRVASHFDASGRPDESMTVGTFLLVTSVMVALGLCLSIGLALYRGPVHIGLGATVGFLGPFLAALGGAILATTAVSQRGLDDWREASNIGVSVFVALVAASLAGSAGAWFASHLHVVSTGAHAQHAPVMDLGDGVRAVWTTSLQSTPLMLLGVAAAVTGVVLVVAAPVWSGIGVLVSSVPLMALARVRVRVDHSGLRVNYGGLPWPSTLVPVDRVETASAIDVRPRDWGGWGYRGSLKLMRQAAVVHRAGPGIRLDLTDGKVFVVTVDDPETGVALLNAQVQRSVVAE